MWRQVCERGCEGERGRGRKGAYSDEQENGSDDVSGVEDVVEHLSESADGEEEEDIHAGEGDKAPLDVRYLDHGGPCTGTSEFIH